MADLKLGDRMKSHQLKSNSREASFSRSCARVQEEESCRILDLRKGLQFSALLIKHLSEYLGLGWQLAVINSQNRVYQLINFQEAKEIWSEKLIELSLNGVEVNVGVRTGSSSRLFTLQVHKQGRGLPFRREDWSSDCVAEGGALFEQHYYELPEGWRLPPSFVLEPYEVRVFGEGDLALAPPSLEPRTQAQWRWLQPPWDKAPSQPSPILRKIIQVAAPNQSACLAAPVIPLWEDIYPAIAPHPSILQALMNPASSSESYYQRLLEAAVAGGLQEPKQLLGLLWHAPLGDARERPQGWQYLQQLLSRRGEDPDVGAHGDPPDQTRLQTDSEEPKRLVDARPGSLATGEDNGGKVVCGAAAITPERPIEAEKLSYQEPGGLRQENWDPGNSWQEWLRASQENLMVERRRYEAMIYELGKLQGWQEICQQERREYNRLHKKIESQFAREVDYLRNLLKKNS